MPLPLLIIALLSVAFFCGIAVGYRMGIADGRQLGRYQRRQSWVDDLESALAETGEPVVRSD
jgi:hypothetical protein